MRSGIRQATVAGALLALVSAFPVGARAGMVVIPRIGLNTTSVHDHQGPGTPESSSGYQVGCDFRLGSPALFLQPGLAWKRSGFKLESDGSTPFEDATFHSWQVPVTIGTTALEGERLDVVLTAGMVLDLIASTGDDQALDEDRLRNGTWAARIGVGIGSSRYELDLVHDIGITEFMKSVYANSLKTNTTSLRIGLRF